jgi:hypothetical protein
MSLGYYLIALCSGALQIVLLWSKSPTLAIVVAPFAASAVTCMCVLLMGLRKLLNRRSGGLPSHW